MGAGLSSGQAWPQSWQHRGQWAGQRVTRAVAFLCQPVPPQQCSHPPDLCSAAGQCSPKLRALGGNLPSETGAAPRARHGVCVQAAAETRLSHPRCRGRAMELGQDQSISGSTSALHRQMLSCSTQKTRWKESRDWKPHVSSMCPRRRFRPEQETCCFSVGFQDSPQRSS